MLKLAVRALAELVHRRGDLHAGLDGRTRAEEGIAAQRKLQRGRPGSYLRERPVSHSTVLAGVQVSLTGRIDGCDLEGPQLLVEEFKTTRAELERAHAHHASTHWAQARLYAGLLVEELGDGRGVELRLVYCHPQTLETRTFTRVESADDVRGFLTDTLADYERWLIRQRAHEVARDERLRSLEFPFPSFRPFQRAMARRVYRALRDREHLLLEAPTGSGKTAATLFPAVRALEASGYRRILFLTSRTTGARAARQAAAGMDPAGGFLRHVTVTAKEKVCFLPGTPCEPAACPYARGYYDRSPDAVTALLERRVLDPAAIAEVAREHQVCPFELSLDAAIWCDLVVADYNYVFDPVVRLQRLAGDPQTALLVDESHQLASRVRDMLSLALRRQELRAAQAEHPPEPLARRLRSLGRALADLKRVESLREEKLIGRPDSLLRSMQRFVDDAATSEHPLEGLPAVRELLFTCSRWLRAESWYDPQRFVFLAAAPDGHVEVRLACLDPGPYIRARLAEFGGHVRFSGTVSPLPLYAQLHGEPEAPVERAGNPFDASQLRVLVVDDVPTYLRSRHDSAAALAALIDAVVGCRGGHYLAAFPSFDYLNLAADALHALWERPPGRDPAILWERPPGRDPAILWERPPGRDPAILWERPPGRDSAPLVLRQTPAMSEAERAAFLSAFAPDAPPTIGFVVLGGVFGESVDFSAARLTGVVCVGVGLPPPSLTRTALEQHFDDRGLDGAAVAYHQPAMVKVLQMAGRLLRSPEDRGVVCLVDGRFARPAYRRFFPAHWQPTVVRAARVQDELARFWSAEKGPVTG